jgi:hypothetical protein
MNPPVHTPAPDAITLTVDGITLTTTARGMAQIATTPNADAGITKALIAMRTAARACAHTDDAADALFGHAAAR